MDAAAQPVLHRFWGTACRCGEAVYLILFINERCLVLARDERLWEASGRQATN